MGKCTKQTQTQNITVEHNECKTLCCHIHLEAITFPVEFKISAVLLADSDKTGKNNI